MVENDDDWKPAFDEHASTRREYGSQGYRLFHGSGEPNELLILFEWDSAENAKRFMDASDLKDVMADAGVVGEPEIYVLDEIESWIPEELAP